MAKRNNKNDSLRILIGDGVCIKQTLRISIHPNVGKVAIAQVSEAGLRGWVAYRINVIRTVNLGYRYCGPQNLKTVFVE